MSPSIVKDGNRRHSLYHLRLASGHRVHPAIRIGDSIRMVECLIEFRVRPRVRMSGTYLHQKIIGIVDEHGPGILDDLWVLLLNECLLPDRLLPKTNFETNTEVFVPLLLHDLGDLLAFGAHHSDER